MDVDCPNCEVSLPLTVVLGSALCWASSSVHAGCFSVAFRCPHCGAPSHFTPIGIETEVGILGAGPTLDPVAGERYPLRLGVERRGDSLVVQHESKTLALPSAAAYIAGAGASHGR